MIRQGTVMIDSPAIWMPENLADAWQLKHRFGPDAQYIAGGTLMQTHWQKGIEYPANLISLERIKEMQGIIKSPIHGQAVTRIGALTSLDVCRQHSEIAVSAPLLTEAARSIAAPAVRNKATIGGNIANRFGDSIPALLAMDASLALFDGKEILLTLLSDYIRMESSIKNLILVYVLVPETDGVNNGQYFYKKLGHREAFSPSILTVAGYCRTSEQNEILEIRLAASGSTTPPQRFIHTEQVLNGCILSHELLTKAIQTIKDEMNVNTDPFSSAGYKKAAAANLIVSGIVGKAG